MRRTSTLLLLFLLASAALAKHAASNDSYVLREGGITYMLGKGMPAGEVKALQKRFGDRFLWSRRNGQRYVTTDTATVKEVLGVIQRHGSGPERDRHLAAVVDKAIRSGAARRV